LLLVSGLTRTLLVTDRWAGMCRSPASREEHFRLEKELLALADSEERLAGICSPEQASNHAPVKPH